MTNYIYRIYFLFSVFIITVFNVKGEIRLPSYFSDNMVIQRDEPFVVKGWVDSADLLSVFFNSDTLYATPNGLGDWRVTFDPVSKGEDLTIKIKSNKDSIILNNILVGDIWLCSGQSNMAWPLSATNNYEKELSNQDSNWIRILQVQRDLAFKKKDNLKKTKWSLASGVDLSSFSAVGYYFGKYVYENSEIPVGLINSSWGGTNIQAWTPYEYTTKYKSSRRKAKKNFKKKESLQNIFIERRQKRQDWIDRHYPDSSKDLGLKQKWFYNKTPVNNWNKVEIPFLYSENKNLNHFKGVVWYKTSFKLPEKLNHAKVLFLRLGLIKTMDEVWINGKKIGSSRDANKWRSYKFDANILKKEGNNIITVRVFNYEGNGGFAEPVPEKMNIAAQRYEEAPVEIKFNKVWYYKIGYKLENPIKEEFLKLPVLHPNENPSGLYNAMIYPLKDIPVKGVVWYQGESNAKDIKEAYRYRYYLENLIGSWENTFNKELYFYVVQLANYNNKHERCKTPCDSKWAVLRESQQRAAMSSGDGCAVIIDSGNPDDIHPRNKRIVGRRLAMHALNDVYGNELKAESPVFDSLTCSEELCKVYFRNVYGGLRTNDNSTFVKGFQIAGKKGEYIFTDAKIVSENEVYVNAGDVKNPQFIRYAWEDNPEDANLFNSEGLPACPFRTDNFKIK